MQVLKKEEVSFLLEQICVEYFASEFYFKMATIVGRKFKGFASYFLKESEEEREHAINVRKYVLDLISYNSPDAVIFFEETLGDFVVSRYNVKIENGFSESDLVTIFETILFLERSVSERLMQLVQIAKRIDDDATINFFTNMLQEQVTAIGEFTYLLDRIKASIDDVAAIYALDDELGRN